MARTRRALMPTFLARRFRQWSLVSSHERGPPMATSMGRTRSSAADIAESPADFDDFAGMASLMVATMKKAQNWTHIGTLSRRLAARLVAQREAQIFAGDKGVATPFQDAATKVPGPPLKGRGFEGGAATPGVRGSVAARHPAGGDCHQSGGGLDAQELALRGEDVGGIRRAGRRVRSAMHVDVGNEIRDASNPARGEAGRKSSPVHGSPPFSNNSALTPNLRRTETAT